MSPITQSDHPTHVGEQKMALPAGTRLIGEPDTVTGEFHGHVDQF